eukprot:4577402-Amphidinium_carterae.1
MTQRPRLHHMAPHALGTAELYAALELLRGTNAGLTLASRTKKWFAEGTTPKTSQASPQEHVESVVRFLTDSVVNNHSVAIVGRPYEAFEQRPVNGTKFEAHM